MIRNFLIAACLLLASLNFSACGSEGNAGSRSNADEWTWVSGSNVGNQPGTYGILGMTGPSNIPSGRQNAVSWTDTSGNFWLFGGFGYDSNGRYGLLNDLWEYNTSTGQWTWVNGASVVNQSGTYGTLGTAAPSNIPGARWGSVSWTDASGNFWLFGGGGFDSAGTDADLNDLWKYSAGQWTWIGGSNIGNQSGMYGTKGTSDPSNIPGARSFATSWADASGDFWLFGGGGYDSVGTADYLNDLWKYSGGEWTWMSGANVVDQPGTYGTQGTAAPNNVPGARIEAAGWTDASGNLWLFGGSPGPKGYYNLFNDLWEYSAGEWTWVSGSNTVDQLGTYGTQGTAAASNIPGARATFATWTDASGNLRLFGGSGYGESGGYDLLNDLWTYSAGEWTWMGGSTAIDEKGTYGTLGKAAPGNIPGARYGAVVWTDASGDLWLFGGLGFDSTGTSYCALNDLWKYGP